MEQYHNALQKEIKNFILHHTVGPLETIYIGGGTPSTYPLPLLLDMFGTLRKNVPFTPDIEITLEVNPGTATEQKVCEWALMGINRMSIGVQSFKQDVLYALNRKQALIDVIQLLDWARGKFHTVSIDMIIGLPGVNAAAWKDSIATITQWPINHCSIYFLTVHETTPLYFSVQKNQVQLPADEETVDLYYWTTEYLQRFGFEQYEVSSFAKDGHRSKHNRNYWQQKPFVGFGLGAWSFDGSARMRNEKNLMTYIRGVETNGDIVTFSETLSAQQLWLEKVMLGLRQVAGIATDVLMQGLVDDEQQKLAERINFLEQKGLVLQEGSVIKLSSKAFVLEHEVVRLLTF
jgi:oxygen-independent coproporphyrinogen-3 oxidase